MTEKTFDIVKEYGFYIETDMNKCPVRMSSGNPLPSSIPLLILDSENRRCVIFGDPDNLDPIWRMYHKDYDGFVRHVFDDCYIIVCTDGFIIRCNVMHNDIMIDQALLNIVSNDVNGELETIGHYLDSHWNWFDRLRFHVEAPFRHEDERHIFDF